MAMQRKVIAVFAFRMHDLSVCKSRLTECQYDGHIYTVQRPITDYWLQYTAENW